MKRLPTMVIAAGFWLCSSAPRVAYAQDLLPYTLTEGFYQGEFVRVGVPGPTGAEAGLPVRGEVRLEVAPGGGIFGVFSAGQAADGSPAVPYANFHGQIDPLSRRGSIKISNLAGLDGSALTAVGTEKIPVLLYLDGRLVGGSVDAQGGALAFRTNFVPLTSLPSPLPAP